MAQEPRSFFERITGARILGSENKAEVADDGHLGGLEQQSYDEYELPEEMEGDELDDAVEEEDVEIDDDYSDEDVGLAEEQEGQLTVDVFQDDQNIIIQSTIAGVSPEDLDVSITNDMVTVRGERRKHHDVDSEDYFYQECYWGAFSRSIILPVEIDADRAEAKIKNGVLTIRIPKANAAMTRKLKVKGT